MKSSIGILLISTWKYNKFINPLISEIRQYLFPNSNVKIYLHTDSEDKHYADTIIKIQHQPWPLVTLKRFNLFLYNKDSYTTDYLVYLDIDSKIINTINENILSDFFVVEHAGWKGTRGTPDTNKQSTAYIADDEILTYVCGGFFGGRKEIFLDASKIMSDNIQKDLDNDTIALWHDESHLNRYIIDNKDKITILPYTHMYINGCKDTDMKKYNILAVDKIFNKYEK